MSVRLRLRRTGARKKACFRVVAADQRSPRDGRFIEVIGVYDPRKDQEKLNLERVDYWLSQGAEPSETVAAIIQRVREGLPAPPRRQKKRYRDGQAAEEAETPAAEPAAEKTANAAESEPAAVEAAPDEAAEPEVAASEPAKVAEPAAEAVAVEAEVAASASSEPAPEETMDAAAAEPAGAEAAEAADSDKERPAGA